MADSLHYVSNRQVHTTGSAFHEAAQRRQRRSSGCDSDCTTHLFTQQPAWTCGPAPHTGQTREQPMKRHTLFETKDLSPADSCGPRTAKRPRSSSLSPSTTPFSLPGPQGQWQSSFPAEHRSSSAEAPPMPSSSSDSATTCTDTPARYGATPLSGYLPQATSTSSADTPASLPDWVDHLHLCARSLGLASPATVQLAVHCWRRLAVLMPLLLLPGIQQTYMAVCVWVAAKLEEHRRAVPNATQLCLGLGVSAATMCQLEVEVMVLLDWSPYRGFILEEDNLTYL